MAADVLHHAHGNTSSLTDSSLTGCYIPTEADPSKEDSSHLKGDVHPSESKKRSISSRVSSPDDEKGELAI